MSNFTLSIPESVSFEEAIALSQQLMESMESQSADPSIIQHSIAQLVASQNGARGFFVTYLTDERFLADTPSIEVLQALQSAPETVAELLVKNLAMSSAMIITYRRHQREDLAIGSERVRSRTLGLMQQLQLPLISDKLQQLQHSLTEQGVYSEFLSRWGYDDEQRCTIGSAVSEAIARS